MPLLRRVPDEGSAAAARVAGLLVRPSAPGPGWVPPPLDEGAADGTAEDTAAGTAGLVPSTAVAPETGASAAAQAATVSPSTSAPSVRGGARHTARHAAQAAAHLVARGTTAHPSAHNPAALRSPADDLPVDDAAVPGAPERSWAARRLPSTLAGGRLDPGRTGAAVLLVVALLAAVVAGAVVLRGRPVPVEVPQVVASGVPLPGAGSTGRPPADPAGEVVVSVAGTVLRPGLVRLPAGSRVDDAVRAAGGVAPGGEVGLLNLARRVVDGEQVLVGVAPPPGAPVGSAATSGGRLDLNAATVADLDALPGIGPVLAQRIVDWRTEHGRFSSVDELREVTGIGPSKFDDLEDAVVV